MGGLGNQLFQYAQGLSLACEVDLVDFVPMNRRWRNDQPDILDYKLEEQISVVDLSSTFLSRSKLLNYSIRISAKKKYPRFIKLTISFFLTVLTLFRNCKIVRFYISRGLSDFSVGTNANCLVGYFQNESMLKSIKDSGGLELLVPSDIVQKYSVISLIDQPLVVHFRLTDYLTETGFGTPSKDYYSKAINFMLKKNVYGKIWVFSDDIELAKIIFPKEHESRAFFISEPNASPAEILEILRLGKGYIIANSSFSWWGAALSRTISPEIICPSPWFLGAESPDNLFPKDWTSLDSISGEFQSCGME